MAAIVAALAPAERLAPSMRGVVAAQSTEGILGDARLLALDSYGHTAQGGLSRCIDDAVDRYMIRLRLPRRGLVRRPDLRPFDAIPERLAGKQKQREERFPQPPLEAQR